MPQIENSDDLRFIAIIRFFAYQKESRAGFYGQISKIDVLTVIPALVPV